MIWDIKQLIKSANLNISCSLFFVVIIKKKRTVVNEYEKRFEKVYRIR